MALRGVGAQGGHGGVARRVRNLRQENQEPPKPTKSGHVNRWTLKPSKPSKTRRRDDGCLNPQGPPLGGAVQGCVEVAKLLTQLVARGQVDQRAMGFVGFAHLHRGGDVGLQDGQVLVQKLVYHLLR